MRELVLPNDTNSHGNVLGGKVLHLMDLACAMVAMRHCRRPVVTAAMDNVEFLAPIPGGHFMILKAMVNYTGRSSMEIGVRVEGEDPRTGDITHTSSAYLSFVALDDLKNSDRQNPYPFYLLGKTYLILQIVATSDIESILRNSLDSERVILKDKTERSMKGLKTGLQVEVNNCLLSLQRKDWNQATVSIQKAYKRYPNDFQVLGLFAQCLHINGRTNEAFALIQKIPLTFRNTQINLLLNNIRKKLNG